MFIDIFFIRDIGYLLLRLLNLSKSVSLDETQVKVFMEKIDGKQILKQNFFSATA